MSEWSVTGMICLRCRGLGYVMHGDAVAPCFEPACELEAAQKAAAEVLEHNALSSPAGPLRDMLKGNREFRTLAMPFVVSPGVPVGLKIAQPDPPPGGFPPADGNFHPLEYWLSAPPVSEKHGAGEMPKAEPQSPAEPE